MCQEVAKAKNVCQVRQQSWNPAAGCQHLPCSPLAQHDTATLIGRAASNSALAASDTRLLPLQVCLLDLDYNLPVQVRDMALGMDPDNLPQSDVGKEYRLNQMTQDGVLDSSYTKSLPNETIMRLQRTTPYYQVRYSAC